MVARNVPDRVPNVPNADQPNTPNAGETPAAADGGSSSSETLTRADVESLLAKQAKTYNGELASLRKKLDRGTEKQQPSDATSGGAPATITHEDLKIHRQVAKLEAQVGDDLIAELGEEYASLPAASQLLMLKGIQHAAQRADAARAETAEEKKSGGDEAEKPGREPAKNRQNARAEASVPRDASPQPRTKQEFWELKKANPKRYEQLLSDDKFDLKSLPFR